MEDLAESGQFIGVIDYTTNEVYDPLVGGIHDAGPDRLARICKLDIPQVIVPGCIDFSVFHTGAIPEALSDRPVYDHNPEYALVRTSPDEMVQLAHIFTEKLSPAVGRLAIEVPTEGLSIPNVPDGVFWNPESDKAFLDTLRTEMGKSRPDVPISAHAYHVNDPTFGVIVAERFLELI